GEPIRDFRVPAAHNALGWFPHYTFLQPRLDSTLRAEAQRLDEVDCRFGVGVLGLEQDSDGVTVTLRHPDASTETVRARYAIACDGAASPIRKALNIPLVDYG